MFSLALQENCKKKEKVSLLKFIKEIEVLIRRGYNILKFKISLWTSRGRLSNFVLMVDLKRLRHG